MKVSFFTLGCKVNQFETEAMIEILENDGFEIVESSKDTDVFIINTCAVTNESDRKSRQIIKKVKKLNNNAIIVAVGCSVQLNSEKIENETPVDIVIGTKHKSNIDKYIREYIEEKNKIFDVETLKKDEKFEELKINQVHGRTRANIKIQDGCRQFCSYCIIPYVRGPIRSRKKDNILDEVRKLANNNYKEIVLNGIHLLSYGEDLKNSESLIDIVEEIEKIDGIKRIRLGSLEPRITTEEFVKRLHNCSKICDHFHLSMQSGSDDVLKRMNRKYTTKEYEKGVEIIRKIFPKAGITTDVIVGFPGETEKEFEETYKFVEKIGFSKIHVFKYSPRKGTKAAEFDNQINGHIKIMRSKAMSQLGEELTNKFMNKFINDHVEVLFELKRNDKYFEGYTRNYLKVLSKSDININNSIMNIKIRDVVNDYLIV